MGVQTISQEPQSAPDGRRGPSGVTKHGWEGVAQPREFLSQAPPQDFQVPAAFAVIRNTLDSSPGTFVVVKSLAFNPWRTHGAEQ